VCDIYVCFSSGIIWEEKRKRRYKALPLKDCLLLEAAWQKYQTEIAVGKNPNHLIILENKMEVSSESYLPFQ
jgi:vacuolar protein sorting-associated protein 13A/C